MTPVCPFVKAARPDDSTSKKSGENSVKHQVEPENKCPFKKEANDSASASPKCPLGFDQQTFKIGPFSCVICQALLFESSKCVPCSHIFCKYVCFLMCIFLRVIAFSVYSSFLIFYSSGIRACISRFKDCPLCGADIEKIEPDANLQGLVDRFIEGHGRIRRSVSSDKGQEAKESGPVIYEDVSLERGSFLVQHAMRVSMAFAITNVKSYI